MSIYTQLTPVNISILLLKYKAFRSVRVTTVALEKQRPVWLYHIFPHYLISGAIFGGGGGVIQHKTCVLLISYTYVYKQSNTAVYSGISY
jgi:hypothetical protein